MTEQKYSSKEALNRLIRLLKGNPPSSDVPGEITGELLSESHALSQIAEILAGSLPGENFRAAGVQYGQIYQGSGTLRGFENQTWTKIPFDNDGVSSDKITPDSDNDKIILDDQGVYKVTMFASFQTSVARELAWAVFEDDVLSDTIRTLLTTTTLGLYREVSESGLLEVSDPPVNVDVRLYSHDGTGTFSILHSDLLIEKVY